MKDYLMALYDRFCSNLPKQDEQAEALRCKLRKTLTQEQRKMLLKITDLNLAFCDDTAFTCFVIGFRVASGIAAELKDQHYSYDDEQELRAEKIGDETVVSDT